MDFSHFNESGRARMVNVGEKQETKRTAIAAGRVLVNRKTLELIRTGGLKKGDVLGTAQIGGIMGAKNTPHIIPMCHPIMITGVDIDFRLNDEDCAVEIDVERAGGAVLQPEFVDQPGGLEYTSLLQLERGVVVDRVIPATFFIALICASPPTRETEVPASIAGRTPE